MSFKGTFSRYTSNRISGHIFISFSLKCTNLMFGETIDIGIFPSDGSQPWYYRNLKFKAGQTYVFNYDSIDWNWCRGDYIAILEAGNKVTQKWVLQLKEYGPGECPECHGIHKCRHCRGTGFVNPPGTRHLWEQVSCPNCGGTGICQTCDIPRRKPRFGGPPTGLHPF